MEKAYDRVREGLWQVLRMYDVCRKLVSGVKSMHIDSLSYVRVKGGENECFRINRGVRQECIMPPWLFNVYMDALMKEVKMGMGRRGMRFMEEGRESKLPGLLHADDTVCVVSRRKT